MRTVLLEDQDGPLIWIDEGERRRMDLTENGRYAVGSLALLVCGFALGSLSRIDLSAEAALSMLTGAAVFLLISARRGKSNGGAT